MSQKQDSLDFTVSRERLESSGEEDNSISQSVATFLDEREAIAGAPLGEADALAAIALPPVFTPFPNPWIGDLLPTCHGEKERPPREPLSKDLIAGKNDPLYFAHFYPTKVPYQAIVPLILNYTDPGDVVLDAFCGTGMTGVAAQLCEDPRSLGVSGTPGGRKAVLIDLSPAATFIAGVTNSLGKLLRRLPEIEAIVDEIEEEYLPFLETTHVGWPRGTNDLDKRVNREGSGIKGSIEYVVWSDLFRCPSCGTELLFWNLIFRGPGKSIAEKLHCHSCDAEVNIRSLERVWETHIDSVLGEPVRQAVQRPVLCNYRVGKSRFEKVVDEEDLRVLAGLTERSAGLRVPIVQMPKGTNTEQPFKSHGFTHVHHFFTRRNLELLGAFWNRVRRHQDRATRVLGLYLLTGSIQRVCRLNRYMPTHDRHVGPLSGTLYVSQLTAEIPATNYLRSRIADLRRCGSAPTGDTVRVSTQSATRLGNLRDNSVDYIFTDPPFGGNLNYSELNALVEAWLEVATNREPEAIVSSVQGKGLEEYQELMEEAFAEFRRVLKPGGYITVEFHNSQNAVWKAIQEALWKAGFLLLEVRTLDKKKGTTKQLSYSSTVKQDLIITAYKPTTDLDERLALRTADEESAWSFVREQLRRLPVAPNRNGSLEVVAERQADVLFDRMVASFVLRTASVPISKSDFLTGLAQRFPSRDGMFFLQEQTLEYDKARSSASELRQVSLFPVDEFSSIQWLRAQLQARPQRYQDLAPVFMRESRSWAKYEAAIDLGAVLEQNFGCFRGQGPIPPQVVAYLRKSSILRPRIDEIEYEIEGTGEEGLVTGDVTLIEAAKDLWFVPDPNRQADISEKRERQLLREFQEYAESKDRRLRKFRAEAIRAGFKAAYENRDYATILDVGRRLPEAVLQEDEKLLMYYDVAGMRAGEE